MFTIENNGIRLVSQKLYTAAILWWVEQKVSNI